MNGRHDHICTEALLIRRCMIIFVVGFISYWLLGTAIKARQKKLAREYEDDNDISLMT